MALPSATWRRAAAASVRSIGSPWPPAEAVHPPGEAVEVDHWLPTSCSRYSAYFARAAARRLGMCWEGHRSSLGE